MYEDTPDTALNMPVSNLTFRAVSGSFLWTFSSYMEKRRQESNRARTITLRTCWPVSFTLTVFTAIVLLSAATCVCTDTVTKAKCNRQGANDDFFPQFSVNTPRCCFLMMAVATRRSSVNPPSKPVRYKFTVNFRLAQFGTSFALLAACPYVFLVTLLLSCGDIEVNPGPNPDPNSGPNSVLNDRGEYHSNNASACYVPTDRHYGNQPFFSHLHSEMAQTLNEAVSRIETMNRQQGHTIDQRLKRVEEKIDRRLNAVETRQDQLSSNMDALHRQCQSLRAENNDLRDTVNRLTGKVDHLDNQNRRNNLIFSGFATTGGTYETWEYSEKKVRQVIQDGMGITEKIFIERAQRYGKSILVKFLSYKQKMLVLSNARSLRGSEQFSHIYVNEDVSEMVQTKRKVLLNVQRELRNKGHKAVLRFDRLITNEATYTYNLDNQGIEKRVHRHTRTDRNGSPPRRDQDRVDERAMHGTTTDHLLQTSQFPPLLNSPRSSGRASPSSSSVRSDRRHDAEDTGNALGSQPYDATGTTLLASQQQEAPDALTQHPERQQRTTTANSPAQQQQGSNYNLRTRNNSTVSVANKQDTKRKDRGQESTVTTERQPQSQSKGTPNSQSLRGFGRGRGRTPPSHRIDEMFSRSQVGSSSPTEVSSHVSEDASGNAENDLNSTFKDADSQSDE